MNASSQPEITAGIIIGSVMMKKTFSGVAPRSIAASSMERSSSRSREEITTATYAVQKVTCASQMVSIPRSAGQPMACASATNSSSSDRPVMTSGITSGAVIINAKPFAPRKRPKRTITSAAIVPSTQAIVAASAAMVRLSPTALIIASSWNSSLYQRVDQPAQTVTSLELLNE